MLIFVINTCVSLVILKMPFDHPHWHLGLPLGSLWPLFCPTYDLLGFLRLILGSSGSHLGHLSASLGMNFAYFAPLWAYLVASEHLLEHVCAPTAPFLGPSDSFGAIGNQFSTNIAPK